MAFEFTPSMKPFIASSILDSLSAPRLESRKPSTTYSQGARVSNGSNGYIAVNTGTTSSGSGPSSTVGIQNDGTVQWLATGPITSVESAVNYNFYLGIGKKTEWTNPVVPDAVDSSDTGAQAVLDNLSSLIALNSGNFRLGITRNDWTTGTVYSAYDPDFEGSYPNPHYVIVDEEKIYKCLDNNGGVTSTVPPSGTGAAIIELADGYIWKYVGSFTSRNDYFKFTTNLFVPCPLSTATSVVGSISTFKNASVASTPFDEGDTITTEVIGSGTGATAAPRVITAGGQSTLTGFFASALGSGYGSETYVVAYKAGALGSGATLDITLASGAVDSIDVSSGGSDYADATVVIIGDGTGAEATAVLTSGSVTSVTIDTPGSGYTWAKAFVIPGTQGGAAKAVLSPKNGHGTSLATELNANTVLISATLSASYGSYIDSDSVGVDGSFRQISLISNVKSTTSKNAEAYIGPTHHLWSTPGTLNKYQRGTGNVVYVNNIVAVTHTSLQEEIIKISITL